jgi:hypothetical protein
MNQSLMKRCLFSNKITDRLYCFILVTMLPWTELLSADPGEEDIAFSSPFNARSILLPARCTRHCDDTFSHLRNVMIIILQLKLWLTTMMIMSLLIFRLLYMSIGASKPLFHPVREAVPHLIRESVITVVARVRDAEVVEGAWACDFLRIRRTGTSPRP